MFIGGYRLDVSSCQFIIHFEDSKANHCYYFTLFFIQKTNIFIKHICGKKHACTKIYREIVFYRNVSIWSRNQKLAMFVCYPICLKLNFTLKYLNKIGQGSCSLETLWKMFFFSFVLFCFPGLE